MTIFPKAVVEFVNRHMEEYLFGYYKRDPRAHRAEKLQELVKSEISKRLKSKEVFSGSCDKEYSLKCSENSRRR